MAMLKRSKTNREMFNAFADKYKNIPLVFIARNLDYHQNLGDCFDAIVDYKPHAIQEFDNRKNVWKSKNL